jgi:drug/metabolite transporter (DMT)-like permease
MLLTAAALLMTWSVVSRQSVGVALRWETFGLIVAQAIVFSLQFLFFFKLQRTAGPVYLSLLGSVAAMSGIPFAVMLLGDKLPPRLLVGGLLIATGIALLTIFAARPAAPAS